MTAPLSKDLRRRLVRAVEAGSSAREAARRFEVSPSAAVKIVRRARETGGTAPSLRSVAQNARARLPAEELLAEMASYDGPDPLAELARVLGERLAALEADAEHRRYLTVVLVRCEYTEEMAPALERQRRAEAALQAELQCIFESVAAARPGGFAPPWRPGTAPLALHALLTGLINAWLRGGPGDLGLAMEGAGAVRAFLVSVGPASAAAEVDGAR